MSKIKSDKNYDAFSKIARFFFCQDIYEGEWDGKEKYIIATDVPESTLWERYPEIMKKLSPYLICSSACGDVYAESKANIDKYRKRSGNTVSFGSIETIETYQIKEGLDFVERLELEEALSECTDLQRERLLQHYVDGKTTLEIAEKSEMQESSIVRSIDLGKKKLRDYYGCTPKKRRL